MIIMPPNLQKTSDKQPLEKYFDLLDTQFTGNQIGISYRRINIWYQEDLLPFRTEVGKWRTFSFLEACWVKLIQELRKFGISLKVIKNLKNALLEVPDLHEVIQDETVAEELENKYGEEKIEILTSILKSISYEEYKKLFVATLFGLTSLGCLYERTQIYFLISADGEFFPLNPSMLANQRYFEDAEKFKQQSHLSIHLNSIIVQLLLIKPKKEDPLYSRVLNQQENELIALILKSPATELLTLQVKKNNSITSIILGSDPVPQLLQLFFIEPIDEIILSNGKNILKQISYTRTLLK
jgi:DNA-binding transcriptional MerR regulator